LAVLSMIAGSNSEDHEAPPRTESAQADMRCYFAGLMFWLTLNRFFGSYRFLILASRS
jgi:hypothetical protein